MKIGVDATTLKIIIIIIIIMLNIAQVYHNTCFV